MAGQKQQSTNKKSKKQSRSPKRKIYKVEEEESNEESSSDSSSSSSLSTSTEREETLNELCNLEKCNTALMTDAKMEPCHSPNQVLALEENEYLEEQEISSLHHSLRSSLSSSLSSTSPSLSSVSSSASDEKSHAVREHSHVGDEHTTVIEHSKARKRKASTNAQKSETESHLQRRKRGRPPKAPVSAKIDKNCNTCHDKSIGEFDHSNDNDTYLNGNNKNVNLECAIAHNTSRDSGLLDRNSKVDSENATGSNGGTNDYGVGKEVNATQSQNKQGNNSCNMRCKANNYYEDEVIYDDEDSRTQFYLRELSALTKSIALQYTEIDLQSNITNCNASSVKQIDHSVSNSYSSSKNNNNKDNSVSSNANTTITKRSCGSKSAKSKAAQILRQTPCLLLSHPYAYLAYQGINVYKSLQSPSVESVEGKDTPHYTELIIPIVVGSCVQLIDAESKDKSHRWTVYLRGLHNGYPQSIAEHVITSASTSKETNTFCGNNHNSSCVKSDIIKSVSFENENDTNTKYSSVFDRSEDYISYFVDKVVFILDRSFTPHIRVVSHAPFELTEEGWGEFVVSMQVHLKPELCSSPFYSSYKLSSHSLPSSSSLSTSLCSLQQCRSLRNELGTQLVNGYAGGTAMRVSSSLLNNAHSPILQVNKPNMSFGSTCKSVGSTNSNSNNSHNNNNANTRAWNSGSPAVKEANETLAMTSNLNDKDCRTCSEEFEQEEMIAWMADVNRSYSNAVRSSFYKSPFLPPYLQSMSCCSLHEHEEQNPTSSVEFEQQLQQEQQQDSLSSPRHNVNRGNAQTNVKLECNEGTIKTQGNAFNKSSNNSNYSSLTREVNDARSTDNITNSVGNNVVELNHLLRFSHRPWKPVEIPPVGDVRANANGNEVLGYTLVSEPVVTERYDEIVIPFEYSCNKSEATCRVLEYMQWLEFILRVSWLYYITNLHRPSTQSHHGSSHYNSGKHTKVASNTTSIHLPLLYEKRIKRESQNSTSRSECVMPSVDAVSCTNGVTCWDVLLSASDVLHNDFHWTQAYLRSVSLLAHSEEVDDYLLVNDSKSHSSNFSTGSGDSEAEVGKHKFSFAEYTKWYCYLHTLPRITEVEWKLMSYLVKLPDVLGYMAFTDMLLPIATHIETAMIAEQQGNRSHDDDFANNNIDLIGANGKNVMYNLYSDDCKEWNTRSKSSTSNKSHSSGGVINNKSAHHMTTLSVNLNSNDWSNNAKLGLCTAHLLDCELLQQLEQGLQDEISTLRVEFSRRQAFLTKMKELLPENSYGKIY